MDGWVAFVKAYIIMLIILISVGSVLYKECVFNSVASDDERVRYLAKFCIYRRMIWDLFPHLFILSWLLSTLIPPMAALFVDAWLRPWLPYKALRLLNRNRKSMHECSLRRKLATCLTKRSRRIIRNLLPIFHIFYFHINLTVIRHLAWFFISHPCIFPPEFELSAQHLGSKTKTMSSLTRPVYKGSEVSPGI